MQEKKNKLNLFVCYMEMEMEIEMIPNVILAQIFMRSGL